MRFQKELDIRKCTQNKNNVKETDALTQRTFGSREESKVTGCYAFIHIRMKGYFRLGEG